MPPFATKDLPEQRDGVATDGSEVRLGLALRAGSMAHFRLGPGEVSKAVTHRTVDEIWYVLAGSGAMWRSHGGKEETTELVPGRYVDLPLGTSFQFRASENTSLDIVGTTMPRWPGDGEAVRVEDHWEPRVSATPPVVRHRKDHRPVNSETCGPLVEVLGGEAHSPSVALVKDIGVTTAHFHRTFDEVYFVLEGSLSLRLYDPAAHEFSNIELDAQELCVIPRGVHHQVIEASTSNLLCALCVPRFTGGDEIISRAQGWVPRKEGADAEPRPDDSMVLATADS